MATPVPSLTNDKLASEMIQLIRAGKWKDSMMSLYLVRALHNFKHIPDKERRVVAALNDLTSHLTKHNEGASYD